MADRPAPEHRLVEHAVVSLGEVRLGAEGEAAFRHGRPDIFPRNVEIEEGARPAQHEERDKCCVIALERDRLGVVGVDECVRKTLVKSLSKLPLACRMCPYDTS